MDRRPEGPGDRLARPPAHDRFDWVPSLIAKVSSTALSAREGRVAGAGVIEDLLTDGFARMITLERRLALLERLIEDLQGRVASPGDAEELRSLAAQRARLREQAAELRRSLGDLRAAQSFARA